MERYSLTGGHVRPRHCFRYLLLNLFLVKVSVLSIFIATHHLVVLERIHFIKRLGTCRKNDRWDTGTRSGDAETCRGSYRNCGSKSCALPVWLSSAPATERSAFSWCLIGCRGHGRSNGAFPYHVGAFSRHVSKVLLYLLLLPKTLA